MHFVQRVAYCCTSQHLPALAVATATYKDAHLNPLHAAGKGAAAACGAITAAAAQGDSTA